MERNSRSVRAELAQLVHALEARIDHAERCRLAVLQGADVELARQADALRSAEEFVRMQAKQVNRETW